MKKIFFFYRNFIIVLIMFWGGTLLAQNDLEIGGMLPPIAIPGYIITNSGDSISGKFKHTKIAEGYMSQIITTAPNGEKIRYDADDVLSLAVIYNIRTVLGKSLYTVEQFFDCKPSPKKGIMVFMFKYQDGRIKVYQNPRSVERKQTWTHSSPKITGIHFTYSIDGGLIIGPSFKTTTYVKIWHTSYYIEKDDGELIKIDKNNYEVLWPSLFEDCPEINEEVNLNPDLKEFKNFLLLIRLYNELCI